MQLQDLFELWESLPEPTSASGHWTAERLEGSSVRLAKTPDGGVALVVALARSSGVTPTLPPLQTTHVTYLPRVELTISSKELEETARFSVLSCDGPDEELVRCFLRLVVNLLPDDLVDAEERFDAAVRNAFELFRNLSRGGSRTVQGLWGELLLLAHASHPDRALAAWHSRPSAVHDFVGDGGHVEAKTTAGDLREHRFSQSQLQHMPEQTFVASIVVERSHAGLSVYDLLDRLQRRLSLREQRLRAESIVSDTLGSQWRDCDSLRWDLETARNSVLFYNATAIPRVPDDIPPEVKGITFTVDLSGTAPLRPEEHSNLPLLSAFCPLIG